MRRLLMLICIPAFILACNAEAPTEPDSQDVSAEFKKLEDAEYFRFGLMITSFGGGYYFDIGSQGELLCVVNPEVWFWIEPVTVDIRTGDHLNFTGEIGGVMSVYGPDSDKPLLKHVGPSGDVLIPVKAGEYLTSISGKYWSRNSDLKGNFTFGKVGNLWCEGERDVAWQEGGYGLPGPGHAECFFPPASCEVVWPED